MRRDAACAGGGVGVTVSPVLDRVDLTTAQAVAVLNEGFRRVC